MTKKYDECIAKGYHDWEISGVNGSDPECNELDIFCAHCDTEGEAIANVRNANDGDEDD